MVPARSRRLIVRLAGLALATTLVAASCSDDDGTEAGPDDGPTTTAATDETSTTSTPATVPSESVPTTDPEVVMPEITGPVTAGGGPVIPQPAAPAPADYVVEEYFVGGTAVRYEATGATGDDGRWDSTPVDPADYRTRILVRRPASAEAFSGTVVVEWLNVSAVEASPDWAYLSEEIGREGHAYVAVSAQSIGVEGGETLLSVEVDEEAAEQAGGAPDTSGGLVGADPERYGSLSHPGDAYAFDIFTQVGRAVTDGSATVLGGLSPTTVVAVGESQSAGFLTTYLNAVHPLAGVYDAVLVHSRGANPPPLEGRYARSADDEGASFVEGGVQVRDDLDIPVMIVETETDLTLLGYHEARQDDTDLIRTWEVAGTAHSDAHVIRVIIGGPRDGGVGSFLNCEAPINTGPHKEAVTAALHHLVAWAEGGPPPPAAPRIELVEGETVAIARDELGIALGGVRNPLVDVPVAVTSGDPAPGVAADRAGGDFDVCALFGQTIPIDADTLLALHGSADDYVAAFTASADAAVEAGFLLRPDADALIAEAEANRARFG